MDRVQHPIHALWRTAHPGGTLDGDAVCAVCGGRSAGRYRSDRIMADTFTRYDVFRRPEAPTVCDACAWYLDGSGKQTGEPHPPFQKLSYAILPARYVSLDREDVRVLLRRWHPGPPVPVYLILSRVKKKHLILLAKPWMPGGLLTVQFEEETIRIARSEFEEMRWLIRELLDAGVGKQAILAPTLPAVALRGVDDVPAALSLHRALSRWRPSPALAFGVWIARTPERSDRRGVSESAA